MKKYYLQNKYGVVEEMCFRDNNEAFACAVRRNKRSDENWKAYDCRGDLIYGIAVCR